VTRRALAGALTALAALAGAPAASGQGHVVQAVDGTEADGYNNRWAPATTTVTAGETVTWSFTGSTVYHNVVSSGSNWKFGNGNPAIAPPPASYQFSTPGTYRFLCQIHATTMVGNVIVTDASGNPPPPPPPPPLSEQPFPNDAGAPSFVEVTDALRPRLTRVTVRARRRAARVRFRIDEPAVVTVRVQRARLTVKRGRALFLAGTRTLRVRRLLPGTYRVVVVARDLAGNRSRVKRARVRVR
jgi:plastocyanin